MEEIGRREGVVAFDAPVFGFVLLADLLVFDEELGGLVAVVW